MNVIYSIKHLENHKLYIGKFSGDILDFEKIENENDSKEILQYCFNEEELNIYQRKWIMKMKTLEPNGLNSYSSVSIELPKPRKNRSSVIKRSWETRRLNGKGKHSPETIEKMKIVNKENARLVKYILLNNLTQEIIELIGSKTLNNFIKDYNAKMQYNNKDKCVIAKLLYHGDNSKDFTLLRRENVSRKSQ